MVVKVIKTTDGKYVGTEYTIINVDYETCVGLGIHPTNIIWKGDICTVLNDNYSLKLKKIKD